MHTWHRCDTDGFRYDMWPEATHRLRWMNTIYSIHWWWDIGNCTRTVPPKDWQGGFRTRQTGVYARYIYSWMGLYINLQPKQFWSILYIYSWIGLSYQFYGRYNISIVGVVYHRQMLPFKDCWDTNIPSYEDQLMWSCVIFLDRAHKTNTSMVTIYMIIGEPYPKDPCMEYLPTLGLF